MSKFKGFKIPSFLWSVIIVLALFIFVWDGDISDIIGRFTSSHDFVSALTKAPSDGEIFVHVIDVGQGDCIFIRSHEANILIDSGTNDSEAQVKAHLDACGTETIDYFICTHPHDDHIGGSDMVFDTYEIKTVIMSNTTEDSIDFEQLLLDIAESQTNVEYPKAGDTYSLGDIDITVLAPLEESDDKNDMSLVLRLAFGDTSFLFTGDAQKDTELLMLDEYERAMLDCDFLKVAHHGAATSSSQAFLDVVTPKIAAISCGKNNTFGHPRGETLEALRRCGCETILRTDKMGSIILRSDGSAITLAATRNGY